MRPYYADETVTLYLGDCREVLPLLDLSGAVIITDPPYGVAERTDRKAKGRSNLAECNDFPPVHGDDEPFDPSHLLTYPCLFLFGANHYADRLPSSPSWFVWDKRDGITSNDNADCELAWTNLGGPARLLAHRWSGMIKASERDEKRIHPTQKPVAVMRWIIDRYSTPGDLIVDPYAGSGATLRAAKDLGRLAIGIEYEEPYCRRIVDRLAQGVLPLGGAA
jgi:site-specific DNA-methyltransferase (adenine-specific)